MRYLRLVPARAAALITVLGVLASYGAARALAAPAVNPKGTATVAMAPGQYPQYIFPLFPDTYFNVNNNEWFEWIMWRPLYWFGDHGQPVFNSQQSLAYPPVFASNGRAVTITLKPWRWSDGQPVTTRDVQFWLNLLAAEKENFGAYVPGEIPDSIVRTQYLSSRTFRITFNHAYNHHWLLYNQLSLIFPIPQHAWDRTSASTPVGNYDLTPSGARAVYAYLNAQSDNRTTYGSNPLWQVVDGAWQIRTYVPATGYTTFSANLRYSGPDHPKLATFAEVPFTSTASEFDALRAGSIDYGYVPFSDVAEIPYLRTHGYRIAAWPAYSASYIRYNYTNPVTGPLFRQLYVRQALAHLVNQPQWVKQILKGYGTPEYGPVPFGPFASPAEHRDPYPFSTRSAAALLRQHGWRVRANGTDTCTRPGTGTGRCGAGIRRGQPLQFTILYANGILFLGEEMQALKSVAARAGIDISLKSEANSSVDAGNQACAHASSTCGQVLNHYPQGWFPYGPDFYPTGGEIFSTGEHGGGTGYSSPRTDALIRATHFERGLTAMYAYQTWLEQSVPVLWQPLSPVQISAVKDSLRGWAPQDPLGQLYPQDWSVQS